MRLLIVGGGEPGARARPGFRRRRSAAPTVRRPGGNPGTATVATNLDIAADDIDRIADAADAYAIDLVIVRPGAPRWHWDSLDRLRSEGRAVFGPGAGGARIEASKAFAKEIMHAAGVPTSQSEAFTDVTAALQYIDTVPEPLDGEGVEGSPAGKGANCLRCTRAEGSGGRISSDAGRTHLR